MLYRQNYHQINFDVNSYLQTYKTTQPTNATAKQFAAWHDNLRYVHRTMDWLDNYFHYWEFYLLKRGKKMARKQIKKSYSDWNLISVELTTAEKNTFKTWKTANNDNADMLFAEALTEGYKISVSYSDTQDRFYGTITSASEDNADHKNSVTSHANDWFTAVMLSIYKWKVVMEGNLTSKRLAPDEDFG